MKNLLLTILIALLASNILLQSQPQFDWEVKKERHKDVVPGIRYNSEIQAYTILDDNSIVTAGMYGTDSFFVGFVCMFDSNGELLWETIIPESDSLWNYKFSHVHYNPEDETIYIHGAYVASVKEFQPWFLLGSQQIFSIHFDLNGNKLNVNKSDRNNYAQNKILSLPHEMFYLNFEVGDEIIYFSTDTRDKTPYVKFKRFGLYDDVYIDEHLIYDDRYSTMRLDEYLISEEKIILIFTDWVNGLSINPGTVTIQEFNFDFELVNEIRVEEKIFQIHSFYEEIDNYYIAGILHKGSNRFNYVIKIDLEGNIIWEKEIPSDFDMLLANRTISPTGNGKYLLNCSYHPNPEENIGQIYFIEFDEDGNFDEETYTWPFIENTPEYYSSWTIFDRSEILKDNSILFFGQYELERIYIAKYTPQVSSIAQSNETENLKVFPLPAINDITISNLEPGTEYKIYNTLGIEVQSGIYNENINVSNLLSGIYFIQLPSTGETLKFVKE